MIFMMAFRNVFRHKRRTFISAFTTAVGVALYIVLDSLFNGTDRAVVENLIKFVDGPLVVYSKEYDENRRGFPLDKGLKDRGLLERLVRENDEVEGIAYRTHFLGEVIFGEKSKYVMGIAVDPVLDSAVFEIARYVRGRYISDQDGEEVLLGSVLANKLGVDVGDYVTISAKTVDGAYNALDFKIVGIIDSPNMRLNESSAVISFSSADKLLNIGDTRTTMYIGVRWSRGESVQAYMEKLERIARKLESRLHGYRVYTVGDLYRELFLIMKQRRSISYLMTLLVLVIAGVGIANNILIAVYERVKEIGILMAMGMRSAHIRRLFLFEGLLTGALGGLGGVVLGFLIDLYIIYIGIDVPAMFGGKPPRSGVIIWSVIRGEWNPWAFVIGFGFSLFVALVSAYIPSRYASKMRVTECLRFV